MISVDFWREPVTLSMAGEEEEWEEGREEKVSLIGR